MRPGDAVMLFTAWLWMEVWQASKVRSTVVKVAGFGLGSEVAIHCCHRSHG